MHYGQEAFARRWNREKWQERKKGKNVENPHRSEEESMTFFERELKKIIWNGSELFQNQGLSGIVVMEG